MNSERKGGKNGKIDELSFLWWVWHNGFNFGNWVIIANLNSESVKGDFKNERNECIRKY